ncbi:MAG: hypothetical protein WCY19_03980 [Candidatus Gastranaerophilaceae bacterium]
MPKINKIDISDVCTGLGRQNLKKEAREEILKLMPKSVNTIHGMSGFVGEIPNILINAVGTGLVAPIFIKYNFLSKTDEDTRTYSALRQPVSAALAILMQIGIVIPFNSVINNMTNKGEYLKSKYNKTAYQDMNYLEKIIKKENPALGKKARGKLAQEKQLKQLEKMLKQLYIKDTIEYETAKGKVKLSASEIEDLLEQTSKDMFKKAKGNLQEENVVKKLQTAIKEKRPIKELFENSKGIKDTNFVYEVAQKYISNTAANIRGLKQNTGLAVTLLVLPLSCTLLNWIHPKLMKAFFPKLTEKKKDNYQDTFSKNEKASREVQDD